MLRIVILAELLFAAVSYGAEFEVVNKCPPVQFEVVNRVAPALPTDPSQPAPAGYQWQRWPGEDWKLVRLAKEVSATATPKGQASPGTKGIGAPTVATSPQPVAAPGSSVATPGATIYTLAPSAAQPGNTDCPPSG